MSSPSSGSADWPQVMKQLAVQKQFRLALRVGAKFGGYDVCVEKGL